MSDERLVYGGAWQLRIEMEAKIAALEAKVDQLESSLKQEKNEKIKLKSTLKETIDNSKLKTMELTKINSNKMLIEHKNNQMQEEIAQKNQVIVDHIMKCQEMDESIQKANEALDKERQQSEKYHKAMLSANEECERLRDLLYQVQENEAILRDQVHQQIREICILTKAKRSKDDQILSLVKEKHTLLQKQMKQQKQHPNLSKPVVSIPPVPIPKKKVNKAITKEDPKNETTLLSTKALETLENYPKISLLLKNLTQKNQLLEETNDQLKDQIKILEADQKSLLARFREAHSARKRAEQKVVLSLR